MIVWILYHVYPDGSGVSIERVYKNEARAIADMELLKSSPVMNASEFHMAHLEVTE